MSSRPADAAAPMPTRRAGGRPSLVLRWALGLGAIAWVLSAVSADAVVAALSSVDPLLYGVYCVGFALLNLLLDTIAAVPTHRHAAPDLKHGEYAVVRGAAHLAGAVNVHVGQAHVGLLLVREYGARVTEMLATTLVCYGTSLGGILVVGLVPVLSIEPPGWLTWSVLGGLGAAAIYGVVLLRPPSALVRLPVFAKLHEIGVTTQLWLLVLRMPSVLLHMLGIWVGYAFFGITLSLDEALIVLPVLTIASAVPLVPHGIGARDLAAFSLLGAAATESQALASLVSAGVAFGAGSTLAQVVVGLLFMPALHRLRARRQAATPR